MYHKQRQIKKLTTYIPVAETFRALASEQDCVFLDSSLVNDLGRFSIIGACPYLKLVKDGEKFFINEKEETGITFEDYLRNYLRDHVDQNESELPLVSGAVGYFSYDYGRKLQGVPSGEKDLVEIPDAVLTFYDVYLIEDCHQKEAYLVANGITADASEKIREMEQKIRQRTERKEEQRVPHNIIVTPNFEKEEYKKAVDDMIHYIIEGDIYITNMTQQLTIESDKAPLDVFYDLRKNNPSPFGGYMDHGDFQIVCASPERFLKMKKGHVNTRPIKGTRKRGATLEEDLLMRTELENSEKDKSELLMIVDLERNDLNRVCKPGSVKVTELFTVEEYATVFHPP